MPTDPAAPPPRFNSGHAVTLDNQTVVFALALAFMGVMTAIHQPLEVTGAVVAGLLIVTRAGKRTV